MKQAKSDLEHAEDSIDLQHYDWACFAAQQSAEMGVKAIFRSLGAEAWGHSIAQLLDKLPDEIKPNDQILSYARELDRLYIPARYPNGLPAGTPREAFDKKEAQEATKAAREIIRFCESVLAKTQG